MLSIAKPLHQERWKHSGFNNKQFLDFHTNLIGKGLKTKNIDLYHIKSGNETLSVMYNFNYNNHIYFYLCAINYKHASSKLKPGLVSHFYLIKNALAEGVSLYDFMGGYSQYKKTFSKSTHAKQNS